jgi:propionyl-CoA synthetase
VSADRDFYRRSLNERDAFWAELSGLIDWHRPFEMVCDYSDPPFARWFVGGRTNLCHNAVDRHLAHRADQRALIWVSTVVNEQRVLSFSELHAEVQRMSAILLELGVTKGDRVLVYLPMIPEAAFVMLACTRIGAIHSVVFGGFASRSLASRIDDATPRVIVSADAGSRGGTVVAYKPLLDEAIALAEHKPAHVVLIDRGLASMHRTAGRDVDYAPLRARHMGAHVPCEWVEATHPSYTLYTSGTTGRPKGVQRDTGGYSVALTASMKYIYEGHAGETFFSTSDIGWVVGHSYVVYGPLLAGMATIMYEGSPIRPDASIWWRIVEQFQVTVMSSAPTAVRVLKRQDPAALTRHDLSSLRALFLSGEPLDAPTACWLADALGKPVFDSYWQTETGWPVLGIARGVEDLPNKVGSPGMPLFGYDLKLLDEATGLDLVGANEKGIVAIEGPLPPGCMQTIWGDDARFVETYWSSIPGRRIYNTFDWGVRDEDGYFYILGRSDDVINIAGHRLGSREIEESITSHPNVAEVAVVGVFDPLQGQVAVAFTVVKDATSLGTHEGARKLEAEIRKIVGQQVGAVARPARVRFVSALPKTRSGKVLRRAIQALCEGRDAGDLTAMDDPTVLAEIRDAVAAGRREGQGKATSPDC